jgi:hypothetical protein
MVEQEQAQGLGRRARLIQSTPTSRAGKGLFLLVFVCTLGGLTLTGMIQRALLDAPVLVEVDIPSVKELRVDGWRGPAELEAKGIGFRLTPLHADPQRQAFDSLALARALELPKGSPFRLEIQLGDAWQASTPDGVLIELLNAPTSTLGIRDGEDVVAQVMLHLAGADAPALRNLFYSGDSLSKSDGQIVMWGSLPDPEAELRLTCGGGELPLRAALYEGRTLPQHVAFLLPSEKGGGDE